jgi:hypothetical protein
MCLQSTLGGDHGSGHFYLAENRTFLLCVDRNVKDRVVIEHCEKRRGLRFDGRWRLIINHWAARPGHRSGLALALYFRKCGAKLGETNPGFIRLLELGEIDVALGRQIRFNVWAQSEGEKNEKRICSFGSGMSDTGSHGGVWLSADGQKQAPEPAGPGNVQLWRGPDDNGGLLEPPGEGPQNIW